jgi:hypothetical protein
VTRAIAAAASRHGPVSVLVPGPVGQVEPDGAFELHGIGSTAKGDVPSAGQLDATETVVVDELTPEMTTVLSEAGPRAVFSLTALTGSEIPQAWHTLRLVQPGDGDASRWVTVHVPVNPLAELHRHHGFGFTGYLLVLSDRCSSHSDNDSSDDPHEPPPSLAWLSAAFPSEEIILVEDAVASAWRGRALRGKVHVDTRMDFWRLVAHASACVDLAPGPHIARECIEALRFGTPIIVPEGSGPAVTHARAGGGWTFGDPGELIAAVTTLRSGDTRSAVSDAGRRYADARFGDASTVVEQVRALLTGA